jgi:hypothetical protein
MNGLYKNVYCPSPTPTQDHVLQPFEDQLPYHEFSVRVPVKDIPKSLDMLRSYTDKDLEDMRVKLAKVWNFFFWDMDQGGMAYNQTLQALWLRVHNHAAEYYS